MNTLVKHLVDNHLEEIVSKSLLNCHVKGLHSIMLLDCPEKRIRLYISTEDSEMYKNLAPYVNAHKSMSLGFHSHHCNLTLECVMGSFENWRVSPNKGFNQVLCGKYLYSSKISSGEMGFEKQGEEYLSTVFIDMVSKGKSVFMQANEIHTVGVKKGLLTAWLVYEGKEDAEYSSVTWSTEDLTNANSEELYIRPTDVQVLKLLTQCSLI